jgi:hypothetical protein
MYLVHLSESDDGDLEPRTNCGQYTCRHIRLNRPDLLSWRRLRRQVAEELLRVETANIRIKLGVSQAIDPSERVEILKELEGIESMIRRSREQFGL